MLVVFTYVAAAAALSARITHEGRLTLQDIVEEFLWSIFCGVAWLLCIFVRVPVMDIKFHQP